MFLGFLHEAGGTLAPRLVIEHEPTHAAWAEGRVLATGLPGQSLLLRFEQWVRLIFFPLFEPALMREANRLLIE